MRFLTIGDLHLRAQKPVHRKDTDYVNTIFEKLEEVFDMAVQYTCTFVLCTGDVFDAPDVSLSVVTRFARFLQDHREVPFVTIIGNHDIYGLNEESLSRSPLGVLSGAGLIHILPEFECESMRVSKAVFVPCHAFEDIPKIPNYDSGNVYVLVIHKQIVPTSHRVHFEHLCTEDLSNDYPYDLIICGDYHCEFYEERKIHERKQIIYNTGSLMRESASYENFYRTPKYAVVNIWGGTDVSLVPIVCAKTSADVLEYVESDVVKGMQEGIRQFVSGLNIPNIPEASKYKMILGKLLSDGSISERVKIIITEELDKAENERKK